MKTFGTIILVILGLSILFITSRSCGVISKITEPTNIITSHDEFESMYETCNQICDDIRVLTQFDDNIKAIDQISKGVYIEKPAFSKEERIIALQNKINRWIREYNAKSRHISKSRWKSNSLPQQLSRSDFYCK